MTKPLGHLLVSIAITVASAGLASAQDRAPLLVNAAWVAEHLHDPNLVLLHVGDATEFEGAHIPGAQLIVLGEISDPDPSKPHDMSGKTLMLELPAVDRLKHAFESHGISNDSRIVVYPGKDWYSPSTRVIWTLTYVGLGDRVSLLEGGMPSWQETGHAVTKEIKTPAAGHLTPRLHPEILADVDYVRTHLRQPDVALLDVRTAKSYDAQEETPTSRAGHIPGARSLPLEALFDDHGLKSRDAIAALFAEAGVKPGAQVVSYCYIGQRATMVWFAARLLGYDARMYDGSWDEWNRRTDLPVETTPKK